MAVEERGGWSGEVPTKCPDILRAKNPLDLVTTSPNQVAVLAAYSILSYLSLSAHNAWMRENTVSQTYQTLDTRLLILSATKKLFESNVSASVKTVPNPKKVHVDAADCIWERIESP